MIVVVGGHSRNIGKTSVVAGLIAALPEARWTAVKITQYGHGVCSIAGRSCECVIECEDNFALTEEIAPNDSDSGRFLAAGAVHSYWLRTAMGQLHHGWPSLGRILDQSANAMLESNSVVGLLRPDLYLVVLDFAVEDMKASARRHLDRADAYVIVNGRAAGPAWSRELSDKPRFPVAAPGFLTAELIGFVREALARPHLRSGAGG